jgi:hypothetical protein
MQTSQLSVRLEAETLSRVDALRIPARPGEPIPSRAAMLRQAIDLGLRVLELQRQGCPSFGQQLADDLEAALAAAGNGVETGAQSATKSAGAAPGEEDAHA